MADQDAKVSRRSDFMLAASTAVVFALLLLVTSLERALIYSGAAMVFLAIIQTKKNSWVEKRFWVLLAIFALIHAVVLSRIPIPKFQYGMMIFPFLLADGFAMWGLLNWVDRRFPRTSDQPKP